MNISKLKRLIEASLLNKVQIAEKCGISRTTLDNVLAGADVKVSTIESLANTLGVSTAYLFLKDEDEVGGSMTSEVELLKKEVERLTLLNKQKTFNKVVVELELDNDEFVKLGLRDKMIQVLNKKG